MKKPQEAEIKIIGEARYVDAENCSEVAKIGVIDGQYFILLFPVSERVVPLLKKTVEKLDPLEKYLVKQHLAELMDPCVADPLVQQICVAEREDPEGWDFRYGYLDKLNPPKRYVILDPPIDSVAEPFEYVTKLLTATREKGAKLNLEFVQLDAKQYVDSGPIDDEDDED